ncbi:MAG: hybrid sensor histidine kinase/response regulator [Burkholderiaceae bacterium]|nr:hybrid sensor histidine kinase/response regulator [Burkholderiaceae bacterium]
MAETLELELLHTLARQSAVFPLPVAAAALTIAGIAWGRAPSALIVGWFLLTMGMLTARRMALGRLVARTWVSPLRRIHVAATLSVATGLMHSASLSFFPYLSDIERAAQAMVMVGVAAGTIASSLGYAPIFFAFVVPLLGGLSIALLLHPPVGVSALTAFALPVLVLLLGFVLFRLARDTYKTFAESFELRREQQSLNRKLQAALARAESASQAKTRFLASASHDLRQPLHSLTLYGTALSMRDLDAPTRRIADNMSTAISALSGELDALLDVSKLDAGIVRPKPAVFAPAEMLRRIVDVYRPQVEAKQISISLETDGGLFVETDAMLFERVIRNLIDNAIKYTDDGSIRISARRLDTRCLIAISDTGRGIPLDEQARVFEEFYQIGNKERDQRKGLGLGLSIVERLSRLLGLELAFESTPGRGTEFRVGLPLAADADAVHAPVQAASAPPAAPQPHGGIHVLVLDDEPGVRMGMRTLLETLGCEVYDTAATEDAVMALDTFGADIMLADLRLRGGENGIDAVRRVRSRRPDLPAILISGDTSPDQLLAAERAGLTMLHKPVPADMLMRAIVNALRGTETDDSR